MPRRAKVLKRTVSPDAKYGNQTLSMFINKIMFSGKKATAENIVYDAMDIIEKQVKKDPVEVFNEALKNSTPLLQVKSRRVGGATYQVPVKVPPARGMTGAGPVWGIIRGGCRGGTPGKTATAPNVSQCK